MQVTEVLTLDRGKVKIRLEDGSTFALYKKEADAAGLEAGAEVSEETCQRVRMEVLVPRAKRRLMHLLERSDYTEYQLREKLRQGHYEEAVSEEALDYVRRYHYVDDYRYACNYIRYHRSNKGLRLIALELAKRGVSGDLIEQALDAECCDSDETMQIAKWLEKKHFDPNSGDPKEKQRIYRFLMAKGFRSDDILKMMRK